MVTAGADEEKGDTEQVWSPPPPLSFLFHPPILGSQRKTQ
jgi:hypothetical protein